MMKVLTHVSTQICLFIYQLGNEAKAACPCSDAAHAPVVAPDRSSAITELLPPGQPNVQIAQQLNV